MSKRVQVVAAGTIVAVVAVGAALPWLYGKRLEHHVDQMFQKLAEVEGVTVIEHHFDRDWMRSSFGATIEVASGSLQTPVEYKGVFEAKHGPFVKVAGQGWHAAGAALESKTAQVNGQAIDLVLSGLAYKTHTDWQASVPAYAESNFEISRSDMSFQLQNDFSDFSAFIDIPQIVWEDENTHSVLQGLTIDYQAPIAQKDWALLSDMHLMLDRATVNSGQLQLSNFDFSVSNNALSEKNDDGLLVSATAVAFDELVTDGEVAGPLTFEMFLNNMPLTVLRQIHERIQDPTHLQTLVAMPRAELVKQLIEAKPVLEVKGFSLGMPEGTLQADLKMEWGKRGTQPGDLTAFDLDAEVVAPHPFIYALLKEQEAANLSAALAQQGMTLPAKQFEEEVEKATVATLYQMEFNKMLIREADDTYRMAISYLNGVVSLNGSPVFSLAY